MNSISMASTYSSYQQLSITKNSIETNPLKKKDTNTTITFESISIQEGHNYDLTNITPKETYELADKLSKEGKITIQEHLTMMATGFNHQYPPGDPNKTNPNNDPFNLLEKIKSKKNNDAQNLFKTLSSLQPEIEFLEYKRINITA